MKVKELISELKKFEEEGDVGVNSETFNIFGMWCKNIQKVKSIGGVPILFLQMEERE